MSGKQRGLAGAAAVMFSGTFISRGLGFVRSGILAVALLTYGGAANAFAIANTLPNTIYMLLAGGVINAILVPQLVRAAKDADGGRNYTNRLLTVAGLGLLLVTIALTLGATLLVRLYGGSMAPEWLPIAFAFAYWCVPQIFFYGLYTLLGQVLNARNVFGPYMWAPAANNVVAIGGLIAYLMVFGAMPADELAASDFGADRILLLAGTATLGVAVQALILIIPLYRSGFRYRPAWGLGGLGGASRMALWTFAALGVGQIGLLAVSRVAAAADNVAKTTAGLSSEAIPGNAMYGMAYMVFMLPQSLVVVSLMTAIFTRLSTKAAAGDGAGVREDLSLGIRTVGVFTIAATVLFVVLAVPLAKVITFGSSSHLAAEGLGMVLACLALGIPALAMWSAVQRAYYAYEDTKSLFWIQIPMALVVAGGTIASSLWLHPALWVPAAAFWISASYALGAMVGFLGLRRRLPSLDGSRILLTHLRLVLAAIPMFALGMGALQLWGLDRGFVAAVAQVVVVGGAMLALYLWLASRLGVSEIAFVTSRVARMMRPLTSRLRTMTPARSGGSRETTATGVNRVGSTDSVTSGTLLADRFLVGDALASSIPGVRRWVGHDSILEREVEVMSISGSHTQDILDAARRAALVADARLPKVLRVGESDNTGYVVLEPLGGTPLTEVLAGGPVSPDVARSIAGEVAGALEAGRRRGVYHAALGPAAVTLTSAGAVRIAGLGVAGAATGAVLGANEAAKRDAQALVALLTTMLTAPDGSTPADDGDARAELLAAAPSNARTASNLVVALAPWRPIPPASELLAAAAAAGASAAAGTSGAAARPEGLTPEGSDEQDSAAQAPEHETPSVTPDGESANEDVSDDEILVALEAELIAEANETGSPGTPTWSPVMTEMTAPPGFDQVLTGTVPQEDGSSGSTSAANAGSGTGTHADLGAALSGTGRADSGTAANSGAATDSSVAADSDAAESDVAAVGASTKPGADAGTDTTTGTDAGADAAAATATGAAATGAAVAGAAGAAAASSGLRGWLRKLDAVIPAEHRPQAPAADAVAPAGPDASASSDPTSADPTATRSASAEPASATSAPTTGAPAPVPFQAPDSSGWTVHAPENLEPAPATFTEALGDPADVSAAGTGQRHASGGGDTALRAFTGGILQRLSSPAASAPVTTAATETGDHDLTAAFGSASSQEPPGQDSPLQGTHAIGLQSASVRVTETVGEDALDVEVVETPTRGLGARPAFNPVYPASEAPATSPFPGSDAVPATVTPPPAPPATKVPKPPKPPKAKPAPKAKPTPKAKAPAPSSAARDADRYEMPDRRPRGRINATPFVLVLVLAGVAWVCWLALGSLMNAARFGQDDPTPTPEPTATATADSGDAGTGDVPESAVVLASDLPVGTTTASIVLLDVEATHLR